MLQRRKIRHNVIQFNYSSLFPNVLISVVKRFGSVLRFAEHHKNMMQVSLCHGKEMYTDAMYSQQNSHKELVPWIDWIL